MKWVRFSTLSFTFTFFRHSVVDYPTHLIWCTFSIHDVPFPSVQQSPRGFIFHHSQRSSGFRCSFWERLFLGNPGWVGIYILSARSSHPGAVYIYIRFPAFSSLVFRLFFFVFLFRLGFGAAERGVCWGLAFFTPCFADSFLLFHIFRRGYFSHSPTEKKLV